MRCVECGHLKQPDERGWVTVLAPSGEQRISYCCKCIEDLVRSASTPDAADDNPSDE